MANEKVPFVKEDILTAVRKNLNLFASYLLFVYLLLNEKKNTNVNL